MTENASLLTYRSVNPATGQVLATFPTDTDAAGQHAVTAGPTAFLAGRASPSA